MPTDGKYTLVGIQQPIARQREEQAKSRNHNLRKVHYYGNPDTNPCKIVSDQLAFSPLDSTVAYIQGNHSDGCRVFRT